MFEDATLTIAVIAVSVACIGFIYTMWQEVHAVRREDIYHLEAKIDTAVTKLDTKIDTAVSELNTKFDRAIAQINTKFDTYLFGELAKIKPKPTPKRKPKAKAKNSAK